MADQRMDTCYEHDPRATLPLSGRVVWSNQLGENLGGKEGWFLLGNGRRSIRRALHGCQQFSARGVS